MGLINDLNDLEHLMSLMRRFDVAIVEAEGVKVVLSPSVAPTLRGGMPASDDLPVRPRNISEDPALYGDGHVPTFERF